MAVYQDNAAGVTASIGTDDYLVTGAINQYGPIIGVLTDGAVYPYYIAFIDVLDGADYETGQGTWDNATNTLIRTTIETSSNSNNAVNWGVGDKALWITQDEALATDMQNMVEGSTKKILTATERNNIAASKTKTDLITVTVPANLDTMQADIAAFSSGMTYRGNWDASTAVFPGAGVGSNGDYWFCNVSGVVDTISFDAGDSIVALVPNPSISTFAGNWSRHDSFDSVQSVADEVGVVTVDQLRTNMGIADRFAYKATLETPILMIATGQSNFDGYNGEDATVPFVSVPNTNLFVYQPVNPAIAQPSTPGAGYFWDNPDPADTLIANFNIPNTGYVRGDKGNHPLSCANALQVKYNRPVYVLMINASATGIQSWIDVNVGATGQTVSELLIAFLAHVINPVNTPELAGVTVPDVFLWGQSESNAGGTPASNLTPIEYKDKWEEVYDILVAGGVIDPDITDIYMTEPTQFVNWTGTGSGGGLHDPYPWKWEGINAVVRYNNNKTTMISSIGIPNSATLNNQIHYSGDGLNQYGLQTAAAIDGSSPGARIPNTEVERDLTPVLGGNLDANSKNISDVATLTATTGNITTATIATLNITAPLFGFGSLPPPIIVKDREVDITYAMAYGVTAYRTKDSEIFTLQQSADVFSVINNTLIGPTIQNDGSLPAVDLPGIITFDSGTIIKAVDRTITFNAGGGLIDFLSRPSLATLGAGVLTVPYLHHLRLEGNKAASTTTTGRIGLYAKNFVGAGTVTSQAAFVSELTAAGATNTTHILLGTATFPVGTNYAVYQSDTLASRWNGDAIYASGSIGLTSGSISLAAGGVTAPLGTVSSKAATVVVPTETLNAYAVQTVHTITGDLEHNYTPVAGTQIFYDNQVARTHRMNYALIAQSAAFAATSNCRGEAALTSLKFQSGFYSGQTYEAVDSVLTAPIMSDFVSKPITKASGGGVLFLGVLSQFEAGCTIGATTSLLQRAAFVALDPDAIPATLTATSVGFVSALTSAYSTSTTHFLMGVGLGVEGKWGIYQADTFSNRFNGGVVNKVNAFSGATAVPITRDMHTVILDDASTGTITLPSRADMESGVAAGAYSGWGVKVINCRAGATVAPALPANCAWGDVTRNTIAPGAEQIWTYVYGNPTSIWY